MANPETHLRIGDSWKKAQGIYVKVDGSWVTVKEKWVNQNGTWRQVFITGYAFTDNNISGYNYNLVAKATAGGWNGTTPLIANLTLSGNLGSTSTGAAAFDTGSLPPGSSITLTIPAGKYLVGRGGDGAGVNGDLYGFSGGRALQISYPITIVNNGVIAGGGGGGSAGIRPIFSPSQDGGSSGAGLDPGSVVSSPYIAPANQGTLTTGGAKPPTNGGKGGDLGQPGGYGTDRNGTNVSIPGTAGDAAWGASFITWAIYGDVRGQLLG